MPDQIIIHGGIDKWSSRHIHDYLVGPRHTVFEWCIIYTDRNPEAILGPYVRDATAKYREARLTLLGTNWSNERRWRPSGDFDSVTKIVVAASGQAALIIDDDPVEFRSRNAVYRELVEGFAALRFECKRVYLDDYPAELDPTLCMIDASSVLAIARQRGDYGNAIAEMLAKRSQAGNGIESDPEASVAPTNDQNHGTIDDSRPASDSRIHAAITLVYDEAERTGAKPPNIKELPRLVKDELRKTGHEASGNRIAELARQPQHGQRRRKPGPTLASEKVHFTK
jgi:hypothetical protein